MARLDGRAIRLEIGGNFLLGVTSSNMDLSADMIDITNYESDRNKEYLSGEKGATISATFTFDSAVSNVGFADLFGTYDGGTSVAFVYGDSTAGGDVLTGNAFISSLSLAGDKNSVSTCDVTLTTTGPIVLDVAS